MLPNVSPLTLNGKATVLLSATIGLLSVQDVRGPSKVAAIISAFASLGSIIVGIYSIWTHQSNTRARDAVSCFNSQKAR
jgi:hypothetical protein